MIRDFLDFALTGEIQEEYKKLTLSFFTRLFLIKAGFLTFYLIIVLQVFGFERFQGTESKYSLSIPSTIFVYIIFAPILEELIFRNHLNLKFKNLVLATVISVLLFWRDWFIVILLGYFILVCFLKNRNISNLKILLIYSSSLLFAFAHYYQLIDWDNSETILKFLLRSIPQFIGGLFYCYIYFRNGVFASMLFHAFWNLLPCLVECMRIAFEVP